MLRKTDFSNIHPDNQNKSLQKNWGIFKRDKMNSRYRGRESLGPFTKKTKTKNFRKKYYLAPHAKDEYFAMEILQFLGIDTPKTRFVCRQKGKRTITHMATKSIPNYIPRDGILLENMTAYQEKKEAEYEQDSTQDEIPALIAMRKRYHLDIRRQLFRDLELKKDYKISGNFFAFDVMLTVVADPDAMAFTNFGFHIKDNRCFAVAIDKDQVKLNGYTYEQLCSKVDARIYEDNDEKKHVVNHTFYYREREQLLDVLYRLHEGLIPDKKGISMFDHIFLNSRVRHTDTLFQLPIDKKCENFKKSARSTLVFYADKLEPNYLENYAHREKIRELIADMVLDRLNVSHADSEFIRQTIIEDLRGPYYKSFFSGKFPLPKQIISGAEWETSRNRACIHVNDLKNEWLIKSVMSSVKKEFQLSCMKLRQDR